jgi:hypothetical protein
MSSLPLLAILFADTPDDPLSRPEILWGTIGITVALLIGAAVIYVTDKWRKRAAEGARVDAEALTSYRAMYEAGEITEAEYAELKRRMAEKVKKSTMPPAPGGPTTPAFGATLLGTMPPTPPPPPPAPPAPPAASPDSAPPPSTA